MWERQRERLKKGKIGGETGREVETGEERGRYFKDQTLIGYVVLYPRDTSPIDFSTHALEVLTGEGNDCSTITLTYLTPNKAAVSTL